MGVIGGLAGGDGHGQVLVEGGGDVKRRQGIVIAEIGQNVVAVVQVLGDGWRRGGGVGAHRHRGAGAFPVRPGENGAFRAGAVAPARLPVQPVVGHGDVFRRVAVRRRGGNSRVVAVLVVAVGGGHAVGRFPQHLVGVVVGVDGVFRNA